MRTFFKLAALVGIASLLFVQPQIARREGTAHEQMSPQGFDDVLLIVDSRTPHTNEGNFERIAEYYGLTVNRIDLNQRRLSMPLLRHSDGTEYKGIYIHDNTLESLQSQELSALAEAARLSSSIYIDAFSISSSSTSNLLQLTNGAVQSLRSPGDSVKEWTIAATLPTFSRQFTGQVIPSVKNSQYDWQILLNPALASQVDVLITAQDYAGRVYPVVVRYRLGRENLFIDASQHDRHVGDAPQAIPLRVLYNPRYFSAVAPIMMFFNFTFGDAIWHSDQMYANLTIDDPPLKGTSSGKLDFGSLLEQMQRNRFHTTIAFVPVNYETSEPSVVELFRQNPGFYSLVIHGNNHDQAECQKTMTVQGWELNLLEGLTRMHEHESLTGIPFGRIMIFPCGIAQLEVLPLLKKYNFIATVNGQGRPLGSSASSSWDFEMRPVDLVYDNVPTLRRFLVQSASNPSDLGLKAPFNAFIGRPILFYAHPGYSPRDLFAKGVEAFNPIAQAVNSLIPEVQWQSLGEILQRAYLWKRNRDGSISVLMSTHTIVLENADDSPRLYRIQKPELQNIPIYAVQVNGQNVPFVVQDNTLRLEVELPAHGVTKVQILYGQGDIDFEISSASYDKKRATLSTVVCNNGSDGGTATLAIYEKSSADDDHLVGLTNTGWLGAHSCTTPLQQPLNLTQSGSAELQLKVDPYSEQFETNKKNNSYAIEIVIPPGFLIDDFEYLDSPLKHDWSIQSGQGKIETAYDSAVQSRVLNMTSTDDINFGIKYPDMADLRITKAHLSAKIKAQGSFVFSVRIHVANGHDYYLQYMSGNGTPQFWRAADGKDYLIYYLGEIPPVWQLFERNLDQDVYQFLGTHFQYVLSLEIRGGNLSLDDLILKD